VGSLSVTAPANASVTGVQSASAANTPTVTGVANVSPSGTTATGTAADVTVSVPTAVSVTLLGVQSNIVVGTLTTNLDIVQTVGGGPARGGSYNRREVDALYDEWKGLKNKRAKKVVKKAIELLEVVEAKGLLSELSPAVELVAAIEDLPARPSVDLVEMIADQTRMLQQMLDDEDEDEIMLMLMAL
jgi:hypothetical protein